MNEAKKVAAFEITKLIHSEEEAKKAEEASVALFEGNGNLDNMPTSKIKVLPCCGIYYNVFNTFLNQCHAYKRKYSII